MANTYTQIYIQLVFVVKGRRNLIKEEWEEDLYKYITGIIQKKGQLLLAINGAYDHIHILIGMRPTCRLSDLAREIKKASNVFINDRMMVYPKFEWQSGYAAFSYSKSAVDNVVAYIKRQKEHHKKQTFREEYIKFLKQFNVDYDPDYLFDWVLDED